MPTRDILLADCLVLRTPRAGGVSLPTQDILLDSLGDSAKDMVYKAIREILLPLIRRAYPSLAAPLDKQPYPRPNGVPKGVNQSPANRHHRESYRKKSNR